MTAQLTSLSMLKLIKRHALWLLVAFFVALSYFATSNLMQKFQERADAREIRAWTEASIVFNQLIHELQKERGLSSGYLASQGGRFGAGLREQHKLTDNAIGLLKTSIQQSEALPKLFTFVMQQGLPDIERFLELRQAVLDQKYARDAVVDQYTAHIDNMFDQLLTSMSLGRIGWIYRQQMAFVFFLQAKEMAGQERALMAAMLSANDFSPVRMTAYHRIKAKEEARLDKFEQLAEDEFKTGYREIMAQPFVVQAEHIRRIVVAVGASQESPQFGMPNAEHWFSLATQKIDAMSKFENLLSNRLLQSARQLEREAQTELAVNTATILVSFLLAGALLLQIRRGKSVAEEGLYLAAAVFSNSVESIIITDAESRIVEVNAAFTRITGHAREEALGRHSRMLKSGKHDGAFYTAMWEELLRTGSWEGEVWNRRKNGEIYPALLSISTLKNASGTTTHYISMTIDLTRHKETEALLNQLRTFDPLTGLPNRDAWTSMLDQAVADGRNNKRRFTVLNVGIDRFKLINDSLTHAVGDQVLVETAERIKHVLQRHDKAARIGGDRFSVLLSDIGDAQAAAAFCEKLLSAFVPLFHTKEQPLHVSISIGVVIYPLDGDDPQTLRKNTESAMYSAKDAGGGNYIFYSPEINEQGARLLTLERMLRQALERNEFFVHYQPQVSARDGCLIGVEALLRWKNPELGLVSPVQFIPVAEETGLIVPIGEWVMREACTQAHRWREQLGGDIPVAVNLSARQFRREDLLATIQLILDAADLPSHLLELEITEGLLMTDPAGTAVILDGLRNMGIRTALDDFGTGYSSLAYLKTFPIDRLKIDRAFVKDLPDDQSDRAIARTVIALGLNLALEVLAEGVETQAQADFLTHEGCHAFQGFHYAKPMAAEDVATLVRSGRFQLRRPTT